MVVATGGELAPPVHVRGVEVAARVALALVRALPRLFAQVRGRIAVRVVVERALQNVGAVAALQAMAVPFEARGQAAGPSKLIE